MSWVIRSTILVFTLSLASFAGSLTPFEHYEGNRAKEKQLVEALAKKFLIVQENSKHQGKKVRGTHAKGTCADAEFEVFADLDPKYQVGLFETAAKYPARVRFSNGSSTVQDDSVADARSISVSVDLGNHLKQDFATNNGPVFPIKNLTDFNFLMDIQLVRAAAFKKALGSGKDKEQAASAAKHASYLYLARHPSKIPGFVRTLRMGQKLQNQTVHSYRNIKYWSGTAYRFGDNAAAKYAFAPCQANTQIRTDKQDPDFLQNDLKDAINSDNSVCFEFQVQLLNAEKMRLPGYLYSSKLPAWQWVEDASLNWDEAGAKFQSVARLTLTPDSVYDPSVCDDPENGIDVMTNTLPDHQGLGRINRARALAEAASRENR